MRKRVLLIMMALVMLVLTAGCGDDFKGDWMRTIREGDTTQFYILQMRKQRMELRIRIIIDKF